MSKEEVSRTFPPSDPQGLEKEDFASLLRDSIPKYLELLQDVELPITIRALYRPNGEGGMSTFTIEFPDYGNVWPDQDPLAIPEIKELLDYIWERGEMKKTLSGEDPQRSSWERHVLSDLIRAPLTRVLSDIAVDAAIDSGEITPWELPDVGFDRLVDELVRQHCDGQSRYVAKIPLTSIRGKRGAAYQLSDNIRLCFYTPRQAAGYLSRYGHAFSFRDQPSVWAAVAVPHIDFAVLEVTLFWPDESDSPRQELEEEISNTIDLVKWALMIVTDERQPPVEGPISYRRIVGKTSPLKAVSFERQARTPWSTPIYELTDDDIELSRQLVKRTRRVRQRSKHVRGALWHFGRSCLARLTRDVLLDAVVGLEHLLIHKRSTNYRLRLYGAAVIATSGSEAENIADDLKDIYNERSRAVHSAQKETGLAERARHLLAEAIFSITELVRDGELQPAQQNIPKEIQNRVLRQVPFQTENV